MTSIVPEIRAGLFSAHRGRLSTAAQLTELNQCFRNAEGKFVE
jgi:hypothetical protein